MSIKKRVAGFVFLAIVVLTQPANFLRAQDATPSKTKHSLWKVQGKTNAVYLFGSIHFLKKEFYPLPKPIEDAYAKSDVVVFETDFDKMQAPETMAKMMAAGTLPKGETLATQVSKETYQQLATYLAESLGSGK